MGGACSKGSKVKDPDKLPYGAPAPDDVPPRKPVPEPRTPKEEVEVETAATVSSPTESAPKLDKKPIPAPRSTPTQVEEKCPESDQEPISAKEDRAPTPPPIFDESQRFKKPELKAQKSQEKPKESERIDHEEIKVEFDSSKVQTTKTTSKVEYATKEIKSGGLATYDINTEGQDLESLMKSLKEKGLSASVTTSKSVLARKTLIVDDGKSGPVVSEKEVTSHEVTQDGEVLISETNEKEHSSIAKPVNMTISIPEAEAKFQEKTVGDEKIVVTKSTIDTELSSPTKSPSRDSERTSLIPSPTSPRSPQSPLMKVEQQTVTMKADGSLSPVDAKIVIVNGKSKEETVTRETHSMSISSYASIDDSEPDAMESILQKNLKTKVQKQLVDISWANMRVRQGHRYAANTRTKLNGSLEKWITGEEKEKESSSTLRLLYGEPGIGKTCLCTDLCNRHASRIAAVHFFDYCSPNIDHNDPCTVIISLAYQLCDYYSNYYNILPNLDDLESLVSDRNVRDLWQAMIIDPLSSSLLDNNNERTSLIVIDSLDECDLSERETFCALLNDFHEATPKWIQMLLTASDGNQIRSQLDQAVTIELKKNQDAMMDVKRYLKESLSPFMDRISLDGGLTQLAKKTEGSFLCAYLFARNLEAFPKNKKIALRDIDSLFPNGVQATCSEVLQGFFDYLVDNSSEALAQQIYENVLGILMNIKEPIHKDFLNEISEMDAGVLLDGLKPLVVIDSDDCIVLHHKFLRDFMWDEKKSDKLAVNDGAGRQKLQEGCLKWMPQVNGKPHRGPAINSRLEQYALKHTIAHLIDVPRQQENVAKVLCSLQYIQRKLLLGNVKIQHLYSDYNHRHYQTLRETARLITLNEYMKRQPKLMEQITAYNKFVLQKGSEISQCPEFTLNVAANYPNVKKIQQAAKKELSEQPWIENCTILPETPCVSKSFEGTICGADVSPDNRLIAVTVKDDNYNLTLHILDAETSQNKMEPIDIKNMKERVGLCTKFLKDTTHLFLGSISTFVNNKGKFISSGFDAQSVQLKEKFSIECCDTSTRNLVCGVSTFPWGGRSLHMIIFDTKSKKCTKTLEVLKFRFGGSAQFGIRSCSLSTNSQLLCTCVKQTNKDQLKMTVWSMTNFNSLHSIDVDGDTFTKSAFAAESILIGGSVSDALKRPSTNIPKVWFYKDNNIENLSPSQSCFATSNGSQYLTTWATNKDTGTVKELKPGSDESLQRIYGLAKVKEMLASGQRFLYMSNDELRIYTSTTLERVEKINDQSLTLHDIRVRTSCFLPKVDNLLLSYYKTFHDDQAISVCLLDPKQNLALITTPFTDEKLYQPKENDRMTFTYFSGPGSTQISCTSSPDGNIVVLNTGCSVKVWNRSTGATYTLPNPDEDTSAMIVCAVSPKDPILGLWYSSNPDVVSIYDLRTKLTSNQVQLKSTEDGKPVVTDFAFLPHNGYLMTYHREATNTLAVWNQRTAEQIHLAQCVHIAYLRASPSSDRVVISIRRSSSEGELVLTSSNGQFNNILDMPDTTTWLPSSQYSDAGFSPDGTILVGIAGQNGIYRVWNAGNGEVLIDLQLTLSISASVTGMLTNTHVLLYDGRLVAVDIATAEVQTASPLSESMGTNNSANSLQISKSGYVFGASESGQGNLFNCHNFHPIKRKTTLQRMKSVSKM